MPRYEISFPSDSLAKEFQKQVHKLPLKLQKAIKQKVDALVENPHPGIKSFKRLSPPVFYKNYTAHYRIRIGNQRILYKVKMTPFGQYFQHKLTPLYQLHYCLFFFFASLAFSFSSAILSSSSTCSKLNG